MTARPSTETTIKRLFEKYACPVPFHQARTRFLGSIATPHIIPSPLASIKDLWGGELPVFDSLEEADDLIDALVHGLWNELTRHHNRAHPFRLTQLPQAPTLAYLIEHSLVRTQELDGFVQGLFNGKDEIDLPERAHEAVVHLGELRMMVTALGEVSSRDVNATPAEICKTFEHLTSLTGIMETEIHEAVMSCARAQQHAHDLTFGATPTIH